MDDLSDEMVSAEIDFKNFIDEISIYTFRIEIFKLLFEEKLEGSYKEIFVNITKNIYKALFSMTRLLQAAMKEQKKNILNMDHFSNKMLLEKIYFNNIMEELNECSVKIENLNPTTVIEKSRAIIFKQMIDSLKFNSNKEVQEKKISEISNKEVQVKKISEISNKAVSRLVKLIATNDQKDSSNESENSEESRQRLDISNKSSSTSVCYEIKDYRENWCFVANDYNRKGSDLDVEKINDNISKIDGFMVEHVPIEYKEDLMANLKRSIKENSCNSDMIICFFMAHGKDGLIYDQCGNPVFENELRELLSNKNAPTLIGKPKVFIFQSCRKDRQNKPIEIVHKPKTPEYSDFLFIYSTKKGCLALRNHKTGSPFIQIFCNVVENDQEEHLDVICTKVNKQLSEQFTQRCEWTKSHRKDQIYLEKPTTLTTYDDYESGLGIKKMKMSINGQNRS